MQLRSIPSFAFAFCLLTPLFGNIAGAQHTDADAVIVGGESHASTASLVEEAWSRLDNSVTGTKNLETRLAAIDALSLLGGHPRADKLIGNAMHDDNIDVKLAAIVAAGEMSTSKGMHSNFGTELRNMLNTDDPKIAFTTASTLWKMKDPSGLDILIAVAQGERSADYNFWKNSTHNASRTLHNPSALAKIGATQGMLILVPPVGIGMGAYGYLKGGSNESPQVVAISQIASEHSAIVRDALISATKSKSSGARIAAVEQLASFPDTGTLRALRPLLTDGKENVRLTASAAYIRIASARNAPLHPSSARSAVPSPGSTSK